MPEWEEKCWGRVLHVFASPHAAVSCLEVTKDFRCSWHFHRERANQFVVQDGIVVIEETYSIPDKRFCVRKVLRVGVTHIVPSGKWHRFRVLESGKMTEVYFPDHGGKVYLDDIHRHDVGGPDNTDELAEILEEEDWRRNL